MQHGQVLITRQDAKDAPAGPDMQVVGHAKTVDMLPPSRASGDRPLDAVGSLVQSAQPGTTCAMCTPSSACAARIGAKIGTEHLGQVAYWSGGKDGKWTTRTNACSTWSPKSSNWPSRQTALESTVQDHHQQSTAQVQSLQQQMKVQLDMQTQHMSTMLSDQMMRIEAILAKKPRTE